MGCGCLLILVCQDSGSSQGRSLDWSSVGVCYMGKIRLSGRRVALRGLCYGITLVGGSQGRSRCCVFVLRCRFVCVVITLWFVTVKSLCLVYLF